MKEYPEELRNPPVSLVALFGYSELHPSITKHLHSQQPPINALAFPDFSHISLLLAHDDQINRTTSFTNPLSVSDSSSSSSPDPSRCAGILKRDWLHKHRTKVPALVAAFFPSHHIFGDPTQWQQIRYPSQSICYRESSYIDMSLFLKDDSIQIREVWNDNLQEEMNLIRDVVDDFPYVAMDTEFPGIVVKPVGTFKSNADYHYETLKTNVITTTLQYTYMF